MLPLKGTNRVPRLMELGTTTCRTIPAAFGDSRGIPPADEDEVSTLTLGTGSTIDVSIGDVLPLEPVDEISWHARYRMVQMLGNGAQGVVYLAQREGVDGYETKVAVKLYFQDRSRGRDDYIAEMRRVARQAQRVSEIQNDNLVSIRDFVAVNDTRVMVMDWVDGLDLRQLLDPQRFATLRRKLRQQEWERLNDVVVSSGPDHCLLKPGIAVDVVRGCLAGLSGLHQRGIVHCDVKPSNIMIKRTGTKKVIDIDSSCHLADEGDSVTRGTPYYMAPEQLRAQRVTHSSDIASLGYVLIEMLTGRLLFRDSKSVDDLLQAKLTLPDRLDGVLPRVVQEDPFLFALCRKMVAVDPDERFPNAEAADLDNRLGAASFHRKLIKSDLSTEYARELAWWIGACHEVGIPSVA